ncbi:GerMN domain-containing protein [Paenibacillus zanthoxyli]|uniref:GerMN domain-containing protein n=1 Tax=Paenibacillus zanthoxyli TaxID=369399 RepID=UPI000472A1F2|nr:GerMN domain-containing protein [Paenibacillus zanthoxyli]
MKKGIHLAILVCAISLLAVGCGNKHTSSGPVQGSNPASTVQPPEANQEEENKQTQEIQVYYVDAQLTQLEKSTKEITFEDNSDKYSKTFAALQSKDQTELVSLWNKINLLSTKFDQGMLTLDVHIPDEARLGAGGELLALDALRETFFQFEEVHSIDLLVDGESPESLMGHAELDHPINRE